MSSQVFATVAPSVAANPAPVVVGAVTYTDAAGNPTTIAAGDVKITADGSATSLTGEAKTVYEEARAELMAPDSDYSKDLAAFISANLPDVKAENMAVRDIFDISVGQALTFGGGQKLELTLKGGYKQGDTVVVTVYNKDTKKWDFIDPNDVKVNADGTLTVKFPHLCPVAVLVAETPTTTENTSKETSSQNSLLIPVVGGVAVVAIVAVAFVIIKKKKSA
jgi:hypothetical protein